MAGTRKPLIAGNWKMNLNHLEAIALVQKIAFALPAKYFEKVDVTVIPPFTDIRSVQTVVDGDKLLLTYGAQDLSEHDSGAYTGEISGAFLAKLGCTFVVVGHSERRTMHGETDEVVLAKTKAALRHGLTRSYVSVSNSTSARQGTTSSTARSRRRHRWPVCRATNCRRSSSPTNRSGRSEPGASPRLTMHKRCVEQSAATSPLLPATRLPRTCAFSTADR